MRSYKNVFKKVSFAGEIPLQKIKKVSLFYGIHRGCITSFANLRKNETGHRWCTVRVWKTGDRKCHVAFMTDGWISADVEALNWANCWACGNIDGLPG